MTDADAEFRKVVDEVIAQTSGPPSDSRELCRQLGVEAPTSDAALSEQTLAEHLRTAISTHLVQLPESTSHVALPAFRRHLWIRHYADGQPLQPYLGVLDAIDSALQESGMKRELPANPKSWRPAISAAAVLYMASRHTFERLEAPRFYARQHAVGTAIRNLRARGYDVLVKDGRAVLHGGEDERLRRHLEQTVARAGGRRLVDRLFRVLEKRFDPHQQRYHTARNVALGRGVEPTVPTAYLLNLALKHINCPPQTAEESEHCIAEAVRLATDYAATYDLEVYTHVDALFGAARNFIDVLVEIVAYDALFCLTQWRPDNVERILCELFDWFIPDMRLGFTAKQFALMSRMLLNAARRNGRACLSFTEDEIVRRARGTPQDVTRRIIARMTHKADCVNRQYSNPLDQEHVDFLLRPLVQGHRGELLLINPHCCAAAFYEALADAAREVDRDADSKIGLAFERLVKKELRRRGVNAVSGQHRVHGKTLECDIVIESEKAIFFLEPSSNASREPRELETL